ncbi:hypothetical protein QS257_02065 [Terrilactibacillus sp. S3-3]|nr:hypothetical protein QS257_02065 [Terrilactibacillus sp. S3-3]
MLTGLTWAALIVFVLILLVAGTAYPKTSHGDGATKAFEVWNIVFSLVGIVITIWILCL